MKTLPHFKENSQVLRKKHVIGGLLFSAPRLFWNRVDRAPFPLCNSLLKRALIGAANRKEKKLFLVDEDNFSPLSLTLLKESPFLFEHSPQSYLKKALDELKLKNLPSLSLIFPKQNAALTPLLKVLKNRWEQELEINCSLVCFPPEKGDPSLQLAFAEWDLSIKNPCCRLNAFKKGTDKLKSQNSHWEHPGYETLFKKTQIETNFHKKKNDLICLEEMVLQNLSILPLFYGVL